MLLTQKMKKKYDGDQDLEIKIEILFPREQFVCSSQQDNLQNTESHNRIQEGSSGRDEWEFKSICSTTSQTMPPSWGQQLVLWTQRVCAIPSNPLCLLGIPNSIQEAKINDLYTCSFATQFHNISAGHWTLSYLEKL